MSCAEILRTQAFIDGEVVGAEAEAAERHIEGCAECQAFCGHAATLSDAIERRAPRYRAPEALRRRIQDALAAEEGPWLLAPTDSRRAARRSFWRGAFGGSGLTGLAAATAIVALLPPSGGTLADAVTDAHTRALMSGQEIQVVSSDHHTVKPWFAGRVAVSPPVSDFAAQGFKLAGGRLDRIAGSPAATVVYRHGAHRIDLFVWADRGSALPAAGLRHGYRSIFWKSGDLDFAAVSDVQPTELTRFVALVRAQPE